MTSRIFQYVHLKVGLVAKVSKIFIIVLHWDVTFLRSVMSGHRPLTRPYEKRFKVNMRTSGAVNRRGMTRVIRPSGLPNIVLDWCLSTPRNRLLDFSKVPNQVLSFEWLKDRHI